MRIRFTPVSLTALALLGQLLLLPSLRAQGGWARVSSTGPAGRASHAMAYDAERCRVVVFGGRGSVSQGFFGDTWEWDGVRWTRVATTGPSARAHHAMAYDARRDRVVLFGGGAGGPTVFGDTWEWDGTAWRRAATTGPSARGSHAMAYDARRERIVLFGGAGGGPLSDTWEWDGTGWTRVATTGPGRRSHHAMAYDSQRGRVVLHGGHAPPATFGDTWAWDGAGWTRVATGGPKARRSHALAYDEHRARLVAFGGTDGGALGDTWKWDGGWWTPVAGTGPAPRFGAALVYDVLRDRLVLFGGASTSLHGETWVLALGRWADLGQDLRGTHGSPRLAGAGDLVPGTKASLTLSNARACTNAWLVVGFTPLQVPLLGGTLVPQPAVLLPVATGGTTGMPAKVVVDLPLPAGTAGRIPLYFQYWLLDPAGPKGFAASNAVLGTTQVPLYQQMSEAFDAAVRKAGPPASAKPIYSVQNFTNRTFVRNKSCWAAKIDLTGLSPWNEHGGRRRAGTLVSPRHVVFAKHYPLAVNKQIVFVTRDNGTVTRKVVSVAYPAADTGVGLLDADVPPTIKFYKVLPRNWSADLRQTDGLPMLHLDQEEKALVRDMGNLRQGAFYCSHRAPRDPLRLTFAETLIGGDSGNPAFVVIGGEAILILTHHYASSGPFYTSYLDFVNTAMRQLGGGYQLTELDLSWRR